MNKQRTDLQREDFGKIVFGQKIRLCQAVSGWEKAVGLVGGFWLSEKCTFLRRSPKPFGVSQG